MFELLSGAENKNIITAQLESNKVLFKINI